jgi:hypothetical protein
VKIKTFKLKFFVILALFIVALQFLCSAPKSGAGLRIEYKFIIQSKQCIEKSSKAGLC